MLIKYNEYMYLKENLVFLRKISKLTQDELSIDLNVKRYNVADWEQGRSEPSLNMLILICRYFKVNIDVMLNQKIELFSEDDFEYCKSIIRIQTIFA